MCFEEDAAVTFLVLEAEEGFNLSPEEQSFLLESIAQADRGEVVNGWELLDQIKD